MQNFTTRLNVMMSYKRLLFFLIILSAFSIVLNHTAAADTDSGAVGSSQMKKNYIIGIGDILEIITWKEPDFSRENVLVRLDGNITLPLIDDINAAGLSVSQLKQSIESKLKQYIESPNVTVIIRQPASKMFYILGEVIRTGEYPLVKELTIIQAFAMAGGFTDWATKKEIVLIRKNKNKSNTVIKIDYRKIVQGKGLNQNILIQADDTIIVP